MKGDRRFGFVTRRATSLSALPPSVQNAGEKFAQKIFRSIPLVPRSPHRKTARKYDTPRGRSYIPPADLLRSAVRWQLSETGGASLSSGCPLPESPNSTISIVFSELRVPH